MIDLSTIPLLYIEEVNGEKYLSQVNDIELLHNIQTNLDITATLNTNVDVGVFIGTMPLDD